jgi:hypothetical protein
MLKRPKFRSSDNVYTKIIPSVRNKAEFPSCFLSRKEFQYVLPYNNMQALIIIENCTGRQKKWIRLLRDV